MSRQQLRLRAVVLLAFSTLLASAPLSRVASDEPPAEEKQMTTPEGLSVALVRVSFKEIRVDRDGIDVLRKEGHFTDLTNGRKYPISIDGLSDVGLEIEEGKKYVAVFRKDDPINESHIKMLIPFLLRDTEDSEDATIVGQDLRTLAMRWGTPNRIEDGKSYASARRKFDFIMVVTYPKKNRRVFITESGIVSALEPIRK